MKNLSRRSFLHNVSLGAGSAAAILTLPSSFSLYNTTPPDYDGKKLNIALCGLGRYSEILARGLQTSQYCRIAGLVTGSLRKAENWKKRYAIPEKNIYNYRNFDEIIHNKDIDLVYVVLPNSMHKDFTIRSANAGKHVIVEKPMAISVEECQEMINACKKAGVQLAVGYRLHTEPYHLAIKKFGQEKVFGQVRLIEASLGYKSTDPTEWRLHKAISGGGPLMDIGIYCVQSCRHVTGEEPISVTAQLGPVTNKELFSEVEESITWQFEFPAALCPRPPVLTIVSSTDFFPLQMKDFSSSILLLVTDHIMENQAREN
jgi:predicted dehydrogenase